MGFSSATGNIAGANDVAFSNLGSDHVLAYDGTIQKWKNVPALAAKAPLASPTFTGSVTVPAPVDPTDAATKAYVDSVAGGGAGGDIDGGVI